VSDRERYLEHREALRAEFARRLDEVKAEAMRQRQTAEELEANIDHVFTAFLGDAANTPELRASKREMLDAYREYLQGPRD
jgi:hypothetical protein